VPFLKRLRASFQPLEAAPRSKPAVPIPNPAVCLDLVGELVSRVEVEGFLVGLDGVALGLPGVQSAF